MTTRARSPRPAWELLATWDDDRLRRLLEARPDLASPPPRSLAEVAARATEGRSVEEAYRRLDGGAQQVVEALAVLPEPAPVADLASMLAPGVRPADLDGPLERLEGLALVSRHGDSVALNPGLSRSHHRAGLGPPLAVLLGTVPASELAEACRRLGVKPGRGRAESLAALAGCVAEPHRARRILEEAPPGAAELAREAAAGAHVQVRGSVYYLHDRSPAGWLLARGFLAVAGWDLLVMPGEVGLALRGGHAFCDFSPSAPIAPAVPVDPEAVDAAGAQQALDLVADLASVLEGWAAQPAALLKDGGVGVRELRRAARSIERPERDTARLVDLAAAAGLAWVDRVAGAARPTAAFDEWLALAPVPRWAALVAGWLAADFHPSLAGAADHRDKPIPALLTDAPDPDAAHQRQAVLQAMASLAPGTAAAAPEAVAERARWSSPARWATGPAPPGTLADWAVEECGLLGLWAHGSLTTAGRLVAAGDVAAARAALAERAPAPVADFVLQADLTAVAPGTLAPDVARELELMADLESRGAATVYRFGEQSLRRAFDAGRSEDDVAGFLERHATRGVPQALAYLVADVGRRHGRLRVAGVRSYLRSDDVALLSELSRARATARLGLRLLAPTVLVADADPADVLTTLRAAGYLPVEEDAGGALVVTRPATARAPARRTGGGPAARPAVDVAALVARLRDGAGRGAAANGGAKADGRAAKNGRAAKPASPPPPPPPELFVGDDRPTGIAKDPAAIRRLLEEACGEMWAVRISYRNAKGAGAQLNVVVDHVSTDGVIASVVPTFEYRTLSLQRVDWARVLTEAEEEQLL
ncbi:MAG TPA: helicase-associated domain-containing protein [Acidimicrobiales bacterium]|nr:helicase-associated domain-containing protein [Acidimicrobiales bacterium]